MYFLMNLPHERLDQGILIYLFFKERKALKGHKKLHNQVLQCCPISECYRTKTNLYRSEFTLNHQNCTPASLFTPWNVSLNNQACFMVGFLCIVNLDEWPNPI